MRAALATDLAALLTGGQATDVEVIGALSEAGEQAVKAHRLVLAARSPVFNRMMLESGMRESQAGARISLEGADRSTTEHFVRFLYTGGLSEESLDDPSSLCHLLSLGHRFEVPSLVQLCSARLTTTEDTAVEQLIMAEQLGLSALKEQIMDFVCSCRSRLAVIQKTEAFVRMSKNYPHLLCELFARATHTAHVLSGAELRKAMMEFLKKGEDEAGRSRSEVCAHFKDSAQVEVNKLLSDMVADGDAITTIDDDHFAAV